MSQMILSLVGRGVLKNLGRYSGLELISQPALTVTQARHIYSPAMLGLGKLETLQLTRGKFYDNGKDRYIGRISNYIDRNDFGSILREDLINLVGLAENDSHLDMIEKIAQHIHSDGFRDASGFAWGSSLMRLYYKMNKLDRAVKNIRDEKFGDFFNQCISYKIALTMLYNAGKYNDVVELYEWIENEKPLAFNVQPLNKTDRRLGIVAFCALAKMNKPEHLQKALDLYQVDRSNLLFKTRIISLISYMAYKQGNYNLASNILTELPNKNYTTYKELKALSLLKMKRYEDLLYHLRDMLSGVRRNNSLISGDTYNILDNEVMKLGDDEVARQLNNFLVEVKDHDKVRNESLEDFLFRPIEAREPDSKEQNDQRGGIRIEESRKKDSRWPVIN